MSEILAVAAIGAGGFIGTVFAIQQVSALIRERRSAIRTVSKTELERAEREAEWRLQQERSITK